jgi:hypothetical protein
VIFPERTPGGPDPPDIINKWALGREMVLAVAKWNQQKQSILATFRPESCTEVPMTLEDIFIECTRPASAVMPQESEV